MEKHIYITNGVARCGKDTFAKLLNEFVPTIKYSSIDKVKDIAKKCGWNGGKTEKDRKFLSDLKCLTSEYSDLPFKDISRIVNDFLSARYIRVLLIDIREPEEIERAKQEFGAETILIVNQNIPHITSNMADRNVYNYKYDWVVRNNGTINDFRETVKKFAKDRKLI